MLAPRRVLLVLVLGALVLLGCSGGNLPPGAKPTNLPKARSAPDADT